MNAVDKKFKLLLLKIRVLDFSADEIKKIKTAYTFAQKKHSGQLRKSGEPYIIHPLETAILLAEWKMDANSIVTALLHDVLEDTDCSLKEMEDKFGKEVTELTKTVTKVSKMSDKNRSESLIKEDNNEYLIKVLMSVSNDIRPIVIKIADRTHNMQTITHLKREKQEKIALETFNIYASIAGRLGMYHQKTVLLDLSYSVLEPENYQRTKKHLGDLIAANKQILFDLKKEITEILEPLDLKLEIVERIKGVYSTYQKNQRGIRFEDIHDIFALRIIGDFRELKCYEILGIIHLNFHQIPGTFKDYISNPKLNMYQSLHTTISYKRIYTEIQIRNESMDRVANSGIASHWQYKEVNDETKTIQDSLMKDIVEKKETEVIQKIKYISETKIFDVFLTNVNKWYIIPEGSTALDLAFLHNPSKLPYIQRISKDGLRIPLHYNVQKNDIITIEYGPKPSASREWSDYASMEKCRQFLHSIFPDDESEKIQKEFRIALKKKFGKDAISDVEINKRVTLFEFHDLEKFLEHFKNDLKVSNDTLLDYFSKPAKSWKRAHHILSNVTQKVTLDTFNVRSIPGVKVKDVSSPNCCSKVWGMDIVGNMKNRVLEIHRFDCKEIDKSKKIYRLEWNEEKLQEFAVYSPFTFTVTYSNKVIRNNKIIFFITGRGFEILDLKTKRNKKEYTSSLRIVIALRELISLKRLFDDIKHSLDVLSIEVN